MVRKPEEKKKGAPAYVVSMSSLWTIMLTFFICLCNMANEQEYGLVGAGTGSFIRHINAMGLPGLLPGHRTTIDLGKGRPEFAIPPRARAETDGSDADVLYRKVISIDPMRLPRALVEYFKTEERLEIPVNVKFEPGNARLTAADKGYLRPMVARLQAVSYYVRIEVNVSEQFLFSPEFPNAWQLSASRAAAIARFCHEQGGLSYRRLEPVGHGSARALVKNPIDPSVNDHVKIAILRY
ncbi:MAG TPA: OmpA family protein [Planctomycetota bacterium]|nr:OmpA family protein [Planctomycetota bacterium]